MKLRHWTLVRQICAILLAVCLASFASGFLVMSAMQEENLNALYNQTVGLVSASIRQAEAELEAVEQIAYNIIVSDAVQNAASGYLDALDAGLGMSVQKQYEDAICNLIPQQIIENKLIVCANYLDRRGGARVIASRGYEKMGDAEALRVAEAAVEAQGATLTLGAEDPDTLLVVKQLREKRGLSMRHVGVLALLVDMNQIGQRLREQYEGMYVLQGEGFRYALPHSGEAALAALDGAAGENRGYALVRLGGQTWFAVSVPGRIFSCTVLIEYNEMFSAHRHRFMRYVGIFVILSALAFALAFLLTRWAAGDFQRLIRHLRRISGTEREVVPLLTEAPQRNRDAQELVEAFNSMADRVNTLVDDNYRKQLLITRTQLAALQAQMNPHFIYNTLNSIYWAAKESGNGKVASMTDALSCLLRESVNIRETLVTVDRELEIVRHYIRIQKFRFGDRLAIAFDVSEDVSEMAIPKFTLQVLIENAINHGADRMLGRCEVSVVLARQGEQLLCTVSNTGPAPQEDLMEKLRSGQLHGEGSGIGLLNVEKRMKALLGEDSRLEISRDEENERTVVRILCRAARVDEIEERGGDGGG